MPRFTKRKISLSGAIVILLAAGAAAALAVGYYNADHNHHSPAAKSPPGAVTVVAVGDISPDGADQNAQATASLVDQINPTAILGLGDYQYLTGTCDNFITPNHYDTTWGSQNSRLYPTFGPEHDYDANTAESARYMSGDCPGQTAPKSAGATAAGGQLSWDTPYSFDINGWHIISLPSICLDYHSCSPTAVTNWLQADLNAHTNHCSIAYLHEPYWTSTTPQHTRLAPEKAWIQLLYAHGTEMLLQGHNHFYERFNRQTPTDKADPTNGIRAFVVGTGGMTLYHKLSTAPNEAAYNDDVFGVLKLQLGKDSYAWQFMPAAGGTYTDSGSGNCH